MQARENILSKIRQALNKPVPVPFPNRTNNVSVFQPSKQELEVEEEITDVPKENIIPEVTDSTETKAD